MKKNKKLDKAIKQALKASFKNGQLNEPKAKAFIKIFSSLNRPDARYCLTHFLAGLRKTIAAHTLLIESSARLSANVIDRIKKLYSTRYQLYATRQAISPSLISGLRIKIGDNVFEDSINSRIEQLKQTIMN